MKLQTVLSASVLLLSVGTMSIAQQQPSPPVLKSVAVQTFKYSGTAELQGAFQDMDTMMRTALIKTKKFTVLDRSQVTRQIEELEFGRSGLADPSKAKTFGKMLSSDYFVYGTVVDARRTGRTRTMAEEYAFAVDLTIMDVELGNAILAEQIKITEFVSAPQEAVRLLADRLILKVMFTVSPVMIAAAKDGKAVLNYGSDFVSTGQVLDVFAQGEPILDPATGAVLAREEEKIGQITVVSSQAAYSGATAITTTRPLEKGMVCRLVEAESALTGRSELGSPSPPASAASSLQAGRPRVVVGKFIYSNEFDLQQTADRSASVVVVKPSATDRGATVGAILGGLAGHIAGNQSAGSTAAGAVGGAVVGDQVDRRDSVRTPPATSVDQQATALAKESPVLREMVLNRLVKTGQFDVIERSRIGELQSEMSLAASGQFDANTVAEEGRLAGAEYVIVGTLTRFATERENTGSGFLGAKNRTTLKLGVEMRLLETATGKITLADAVEGAASSEKSAFTLLGFGNASEESGELGELFNATASAVVGKIIMTLRPMLIIDVNLGEQLIVLNYGEGVVSVDDELVLFETGDELRDPYTGAVLGRREKTIATLRVTDVQPRFSKAKIISRESGIEIHDTGMMCRVQQAGGGKPAPEPSGKRPSGGAGDKQTFTF